MIFLEINIEISLTQVLNCCCIIGVDDFSHSENTDRKGSNFEEIEDAIEELSIETRNLENKLTRGNQAWKS